MVVPDNGCIFACALRESISDYSFGASFYALALAKMEDLGEKEELALVKATLMHDLHETRTGDLSPIQKEYVKADSGRAEKNMLSGTHLECGLPAMRNRTLCALLEDADRLDLLLRAVENANSGNRNMGEFIKFALLRISSKSGKRLARLITKGLRK